MNEERGWWSDGEEDAAVVMDVVAHVVTLCIAHRIHAHMHMYVYVHMHM